MKDRRLITGLMLLALMVSQTAIANVLTTPLNWRAMDVEGGLNRLKEQFLDESIGTDTEFVGAVLRTAAGQVEFTQGRGLPGQDQVTFRIVLPAGAELIGLWHTHGAHGAARAVFSSTDAELVRRTGVPFYLITPEGEIRVLRPAHVQQGVRSGNRPPGMLARLPRGSHPGERVSGRKGGRGGAEPGQGSVMEV